MLLLTACGGGGSKPAAVSVPTPEPAFDPERDVVRFAPALVKSWPGLPNVGNSCFFNSTVKLLAAMPELDRSLALHPADDAPTAAVRASLRRVINFIRSGAAPAHGPNPDAHALIQAVMAAFRNHPRLGPHVLGTEHTGGYVKDVVRATLGVLGRKDDFSISSTRKRRPLNPPQQPTYKAEASRHLIVLTDPEFGGHDLAQVHDLGELIRKSYSEPGRFRTGGKGVYTSMQNFATGLPRNLVMEVDHPFPTKALAFSERAELPLYDVDPAHEKETKRRDATLEASAAALSQGGHVWAVIRGDDGWYKNDDARPAVRVDPKELDERADADGGMTRSFEVVLFQYHD